MRHHFVSLLVVTVVTTFAPAPSQAQVRSATLPAYAPPRTADGKPDLQGVWQVLNTASWDIQDHAARLGVPAGASVVEGNDIPYQPWAAARKKENFDYEVHENWVPEDSPYWEP